MEINSKKGLIDKQLEGFDAYYEREVLGKI